MDYSHEYNYDFYNSFNIRSFPNRKKICFNILVCIKLLIFISTIVVFVIMKKNIEYLIINYGVIIFFGQFINLAINMYSLYISKSYKTNIDYVYKNRLKKSQIIMIIFCLVYCIMFLIIQQIYNDNAGHVDNILIDDIKSLYTIVICMFSINIFINATLLQLSIITDMLKKYTLIANNENKKISVDNNKNSIEHNENKEISEKLLDKTEIYLNLKDN